MREDLLSGTSPRRRPAPAGRISSVWRCAATGSGSAWKCSGRRWLAGSGRELYSDPPHLTSPLPLGSWNTVLTAPSLPVRGEGRGPLAPGATADRRRTVLSAPRPRRAAQGGDRPTYNGRKGSAAMSATHPTRLETRTKESNARASQRVSYETPRRNESEGRRAPAEVGSGAPPRFPGAPPARLARSVGEVELERVR